MRIRFVQQRFHHIDGKPFRSNATSNRVPQTFHTTLLLRILLIHTIGVPYRELPRNTEELLEQKSSIRMMLQNTLRCTACVDIATQIKSH